MMLVGRRLPAGIMLLLSTCGPVVAGDYIVEIGGTKGVPFGGTCLLIHGNDYTNHNATGTVPLKLVLSGDIISCAIQRKTPSGNLRILIRTTDGRIVDESSVVGPFGVVMAAGR